MLYVQLMTAMDTVNGMNYNNILEITTKTLQSKQYT